MKVDKDKIRVIKRVEVTISITHIKRKECPVVERAKQSLYRRLDNRTLNVKTKQDAIRILGG